MPPAGLTSNGKLIHDKVPQLIRARGGEPMVRIADAAEYRELLRAKLTEEFGEVLAAGWAGQGWCDHTELALPEACFVS